MPLFFSELCELLNALERFSRRDPPYLPAQFRQKYKDAIQSWFSSYKISIHSTRVDPTVLLSTLCPTKRTDRVYNIQAQSLSRKLRRSLQLGISRWPELERWQQSGNGDLGECVERILKQAEFPKPLACKQVQVQEVDDALATIASRCRFSGPKARLPFLGNDAEVPEILGRIYQRLQSREAKWFTRLILKDYSCIGLDKYQYLIYSCIDPRLRIAMQMYDEFQPAIAALKALPASRLSHSGQEGRIQQCLYDGRLLSPQIGVKVGSPRWAKAKGGVMHAVSMIDDRTMSVERKYDGEYCQIHVDLSKGQDCIQIFSKSGKDSTEDRKGVVSSTKHGLRIGRNDCSFRQKCILEGELLVWSDKEMQILDFHKIRKHVSRSGSFLGNEEDSQAHQYEHLMIVFYDVLLVDDDPVLHLSYSQRRVILDQTITPLRGRICISQREEICFSESKGSDKLKRALANAFVLRWEGLVLKPSSEPYFSIRNGHQRYPSQWIKMKKDCICGLGDTADFAVVGGGYDAKRANQLGLPNLSWTHFFIGCLTNKIAALHSQAKPEYLVVDCITDCIGKADVKLLNQHGRFVAANFHEDEAAEIFKLNFASMDPKLPKLRTIFRNPFVFDVAGSGFERGPNRSIFTLRFPRVLKIRWDRDWEDCVDLPELQTMADEARKVPIGDFGAEMTAWIANLDQIDRESRRRMEAWDLTEEGEASQIGVDSPAQVRIKIPVIPSHRSKKTRAPPVVRMDTSEMQAGEQGMGTGEVVKTPTSTQSTKSDDTLPTPPTFSPISKHDSGVAALATKWSKLSPRKRKQSTRLECELFDSRSAKRRKSHESRSELMDGGGPWKSKPLREITNGARPTPQSGFTTPRRAWNSRTDDFELVKKMPMGAQGYAHSRRRKPANYIDLSSPGRETTADERSSGPTTQDNDLQNFMSSRVYSPTNFVTSANSLITPPSTEEAAAKLQISILRDCLVLQGSSLGSLSPTKKSSLARQNMKLLPTAHYVHDIGSADPGADKPIVLVINTKSAKAACDDLTALATHLDLQQRRSVAVWNQSILSVYEKEGIPDQNIQGNYLKHFCAHFTWIEGQRGEAGGLKVRWRNGEVDAFSMMDIEALRRMTRKPI